MRPDPAFSMRSAPGFRRAAIFSEALAPPLPQGRLLTSRPGLPGVSSSDPLSKYLGAVSFFRIPDLGYWFLLWAVGMYKLRFPSGSPFTRMRVQHVFSSASRLWASPAYSSLS